MLSLISRTNPGAKFADNAEALMTHMLEDQMWDIKWQDCQKSTSIGLSLKQGRAHKKFRSWWAFAGTPA